jgi:hypothetical protein
MQKLNDRNTAVFGSASSGFNGVAGRSITVTMIDMSLNNIGIAVYPVIMGSSPLRDPNILVVTEGAKSANPGTSYLFAYYSLLSLFCSFSSFFVTVFQFPVIQLSYYVGVSYPLPLRNSLYNIINMTYNINYDSSQITVSPSTFTLTRTSPKY